MARGSAPAPGSREWEQLRARAVELRRAGRTRKEIGGELGIRDGNRITDLLRGEKRVLGGKWPDRVKQEQARTLRRFGYSQAEICRILGASASSVSRCVRGLDESPDAVAYAAARHDEWEDLRDRARALRAEGWSLPSIAEHLGLSNRDDIERMCRGIQIGRGRGHRKPHERSRARELRLDGRTVPDIAATLNVSPSTVSLWVRDLPSTSPRRAQSEERLRRNRAVMEAKVYGPRRRRSEEARAQARAAAAADIGAMSIRDLFIAGVALYWAEGAKDKWYERRERFVFVNSDASVIALMQAWLRLVEVSDSDITYRVSIHADADVARAEEYWGRVVGRPPYEFGRATLKRINTVTKRLNRGADYHGCLVIQVRRSSALYQRIDGSWRAMSSHLLEEAT